MTASNLRFSPSILSRLGEELVPNFDQGIIELVRNAYDADATECTVRLINISDEGGDIIIEDNGKGMSGSDITNSWLVLGHSSKRNSEATRLGRVQVGDKGLGRLAALRMGSNAKLVSKPELTVGSKNANTEATIDIIWSEFDGKDTVDEVSFETQERQLEGQQASGSKIKIENLKKKITRKEAERLARNLTILSNPFNDTNDFTVRLEIPEYPDLEKMVQEGYLSEAEWVIKAHLSERGEALAEVYDWKGDIVWSATSTDQDWFAKKKGNKNQYACPQSDFELSIFNLDNKSWATRGTNVSQLKSWLKHLGGVHIYHNDFRVHPYGDPGSDWLDMNLARVNDPKIRPSTNNSLGLVKITDKDKRLQQKTDRIGFIEGLEFEELKRFINDSLSWYTRKRNNLESKKEKARKDKDKQDVKDTKKALLKALEHIENKDTKNEVKSALQAATQATQKRAKHLENELSLYRSLATAGTTSAVFSHEISKPLEEIPRVILSADKIVADNCTDDIVKKHTRRTRNITNYLDRLAHFAKLQLNLLKKDKRRVGAIDVHETITEITENFRPLLEREMTRLTLKLDSSSTPKLNGSPSMLEAIITNCFSNSIRAFRTCSQAEREIHVTSRCNNSSLFLDISDNGPGITDVSLEDIWTPGFTTDPDGTGFGLTIVKDSVSDLGGSCRAEESGSLGGATFHFEFSIL